MTLTNHMLTGVAIAAVVQNPIIAVPVAFASHFVLDALPHYGLTPTEEHSRNRGKLLIQAAVVDFLVALIVALAVLRNFPAWYLLVGLVAYTPDIAWIYRFSVKEKFGKLPPPPANAFNTWHKNIQRYERTWGAFVEGAYALLLLRFLAVL